jgi:hypothetical protein
MDQKNCLCCTTVYRPNDVPFADERERYLRYCAEQGATLASLKIKRNELLWIAKRLDPDAHLGIGIEVLQQIGNERQSLHGAVTAVPRVVDIWRPWLRFLGWRHAPPSFESKATFEEGPVLADCVEEVGALAIRDGSKRQARGLARAQAGFRAGRRISFASFPVLGGGSQEEFVPSATWTSQPEPVQAQDALEVREQHFDLLPFTARPDIGVGLRDIARNVPGLFVD